MNDDHNMDLGAPVRNTMRALPRWAQWIVGPVLIWACMSEFAHSLRPPKPGEPVKAFWVTLLLFVATIVLNELLRPKPKIEDARPAGLGDFNFPTATEGRVVPLVWGRVKLDGPNVVWYGDLRQDAVTEKVKTGLWSSERITKGFKYYVGVQMALCRGPGVVLKRAWIGDVEVFSGTVTGGNRFDIDKPDLFGGDELGSGGVQATCDFYEGSTTQVVNAYLDTTDRQRVATAATPTAPRYTGTSYVVAREFTSAAPLASNRGAYVGNTTSVKRWSFEVERYPGLFSGQGANENKIGGVDANPINVMVEILTNVEWGLGFPIGDIDVGVGSSFLSAADTCITEGNGFSMVLDRPLEAIDLLRELERQVDGVVFLDHSTGKWKIKLARDDYNIDTVPQVNDTNSEVKDYAKGSWEDTTNQISVQYSKRDDDYKESYALAQDMANTLIQGAGTVTTGAVVSGQSSFPGVKSSALAANLAWRELRTVSYPLARATFTLDRSFWDLTPGAVFAWTSVEYGFTKLPMRVTTINFGRLQENKIEVQAVQDVFKFAAASYGTPPGTGWNPPVVGLVAFPAAEQLAFECPRAILVRDPEFGGDDTASTIFAAARRQGSEAAFDITQRNASGTPGGSYADAGTVFAFQRIGKLNSALNNGTAIPTSTITIKPDPDAQTSLLEVFGTVTAQDMGVDLAHLILVNNEFMLVSSAAVNGSNVDLQNVYRGVLDSVQGDHVADDEVYLLFVGAGVSGTIIPSTFNVDVELRMRSASSRFAGSVTTIQFTNAKRPIRPYPPNTPLYNGGSTPFATPNLEGDGGPGENTFRVDTSYRRKRFDTADELAELTADFTPDASTEYQLRVFVDPSGSNTEIASSPFAWQTGTTALQVPRLDILDIAAAGTEVRFQIQSRHDIGTEVDLVSRNTMFHDVVPTSANTGLFYLGGNIGTGPSNAYTVTSAGVHVVDIGAAPTGGTAQYRINGGAWNNITAGGTSTPSLSVSDTIEVRYSAGGVTPDPNFVWIDNPSATRVAYGCL